MATEAQFIQMVMQEMAALIGQEKQLRFAFAPGTETHRMLCILAAQKNVEPRQIIESAVRTFYVAYMIGSKNE